LQRQNNDYPVKLLFKEFREGQALIDTTHLKELLSNSFIVNNGAWTSVSEGFCGLKSFSCFSLCAKQAAPQQLKYISMPLFFTVLPLKRLNP